MAQELQLQETCFESIKRLCVNFSKDSADRKTAEYLSTRLSSLNDQWKDFEARHSILLDKVEDKTIHYFSENVFARTLALYEKTKAAMEQLLHQLSKETKPQRSTSFDLSGIDSDDGSDEKEKVNQLLRKQECNFKAISRIMAKVNILELTEKWEIEDKLAKLKSKWEAIDDLHWELEVFLKGSNEHYKKVFNDIEEKYEDLQRDLNRKIWTNAHYDNLAPKIEIPDFFGSYTQWISFKDLFEETIHFNPRINNAQKMQHLKSKLKGEAEKLVQHLPISAENYTSCWEILHQRYDNRRLQFTSYVNTMMSLPVIQQPDASNIKRMHDVIKECLNGLANIGVETTAIGSTFTHLMSQKLDDSTFDEYSKDLQEPRELPDINEFLSFLESKFMAYETKKKVKKEQPASLKPLTNLRPKPTFNKYLPTRFNYEVRKPFHKTYVATYGQSTPCPLCSENHVLMQCTRFIDMNTGQRNATVAKLKLCKNCLFSHGNTECKSRKTCKECNLGHHTLLHSNWNKNMPFPTTGNNNSNQQASTSSPQQSANHLSTDDVEVLLTTVQLKVQTVDGTYVTLRALLDQGSQANLITESAAQLLRLPRNKLNATISGLGAVSGECKGRLQLKCQSIHSNYNFEVDAMIMRKLTNNLPSVTFEKRNWPHLENLKLADPEFNISRSVDLLLGADVYSDVIMDGILKNDHSPIAQQTHLGWILCGKLKTLNCHVTLIDIENMTRFWETENIIAQDNEKITRDDQCELHYKNTIQRLTDGKYVVTMPFCPNFEEKLGQSKTIAISQFLQLEKRLERNNKLAQMYKHFIEEYIELGHMKLSSPLTNLECYLPHHGVLREHSTTTKLRVVFNASQKTTSGNSLNSLQEKGPNLQKDIQALILKWRSYKYAFTADIEKMYRCIWVNEQQQQLQKIIWRDAPNKPLQEYQLCTVTYGTKSAPWLALRTLLQLAIDDGHKYPAAADKLKNEFFVDDLVSGHNSLQEALQLQQSLIELLQNGGMNLRKWSGNHPELLRKLKQDQISSNKLFDFKSEDSTKTLGLGWNPNSDTFLFNWELKHKSSSTQLTKRQLLSEISQLYDPLGWLSPITVTAKLLFQKVWLTKLDWNDNLSADIQNEWIKFKTELPQIKSIKLNRWIGGIQDIELLGFCDASEKAYAAVVYSRVKDENGKLITTLLASKTRVAPLSQKTTLPRLELCGALLLSQLIDKITQALAERKITTRAWSDSQVVLAWLQGETARWEKYVANRVQNIKKVIPAEQWQYVKSEHNPADCASRGMYPGKLVNFDLWWNGPKLLETEQGQETLKQTACLYVTNLGQVKTSQTPKTKNNIDDNFIETLLQKQSSLTRITRVTAWVMRFSANALNKRCNTTSYLVASELLQASELITKHVQRTEFETEYKQLLKNEPVHSSSTLCKLNPFLDKKGILRVGGRLNKSNLPPQMKNPAILSRNGRLTQLIIQQAHLRTLHGGARLTLAYIRQRYWITSGNRTVKAQLRSCVRCQRLKRTDNYQLMGDLPQQRVTPSRPFTHTGVDFTGHVDVKLNKGRGVKTSKGYIAIFVCMATKAVHIELVSDLSSEAFIAALQRMCARRGTPKHMYSDCGTNFIGAARILQNEFQDFKQVLTPDFFAQTGYLEIEWHFNAPAWPSAGGLWEAAVKAMKHHLRRVLGDQKLTYEEFSTLLAQIEACLNSRPLCPLTENPEEFYNYITPGHFLTGSPTMSLPLSDQSDIANVDIRRRWKLTEHMMQQFWKTWSTEYLNQLQKRSKWHTPTKNVKQGDIVLIKEDNLPPGKWALGRILELHPGADGYVRVTTLKTETGTIKRPIVKLSPLLMENELEQKQKQVTDNDSNDKRENITRKTNYLPSSSKLSTVLMCLFTFVTLITGSSCMNVTSGAHISNFESGRSVYYDTVGRVQMIHDEWTLLMYYNLSSYWDGVGRIEDYLHQISNLCKKTKAALQCNATINQLYHEMEILKHYNEMLVTPHKHLSERKKRGLINGIGNIANSLFGILDNQFAEKYDRDIHALQNNQNYLLDLIKNQTSVAELQNDILKKMELNIGRQLTTIDIFLNQTNVNFMRVESAMEVVIATNYFNSASLVTYLLINNLRKVQEMLFDTMTNIYKGHIDVQLLSPAKLVAELNEISGHLPKTLSVPIDDIGKDIKDLYKLIYLKARVTTNHFLFEVHIPLITDDDFVLHQVLPIPVKIQEDTAVPELSSDYLAVDMRKNIYISMSKSDLQQCTQLQTRKLICHKNLPVYNLNNDYAPCEAKLLGHHLNSPCTMHKTTSKDAWIELHARNTWLAICCDVCTIRTICFDDITTHVMTASGIVNIAQGCIIQSKALTIYSHNIYNSNLKMGLDIDVPALNFSINKIVNTNDHSTLQLPVLNRSEMREMDKRLSQQKYSENSLPSTISFHDVHQYVVIYVLVGIVIAGFVVWSIRKRCFTRSSAAATARRYEDIELQVLRAPPKPQRQRPLEESNAAGQTLPPPPRPDQQRRKLEPADNIAFNLENLDT